LLGLFFWIGGSIGEPHWTKYRPFLFGGSAIFALSGIHAYVLEMKRGVRGYKFRAIAHWLFASCLMTVSIAEGAIWNSAILLASGALVACSLSLYVQWCDLSRSQENHVS
jgi:hypothetical protein